MRRQRLPKPGVHMVTFRLFLITALFPSTVFAAGFFRPGVGAGPLSMGGTGIASADPTYAAWYNPARLGFAQKGFFVSVDGTALQERTQFRRSSVGLLKPPRDQDNPSFYENKILQNTEFSDEFLQAKNCFGQVRAANTPEEDWKPCLPGTRPIPYIALGYGSGKGWSLAFSAFGPHGMSRDWDKFGPQRYTVVYADVQMQFYQLAAAYRQKDWSVGLGMQNIRLTVDQTFTVSADVLGTEDPGYDAWADVNVADNFIPAATLGFWRALPFGLEVGGSLMLPLLAKPCAEGSSERCHVVAEGTVAVDFAEEAATLVTEVDGDRGVLTLNFPRLAGLGFTKRFGDRGFINLDFFYEAWAQDVGDVIFRPQELVIRTSLPGSEEIPFEDVVFPKKWSDSVGVRIGGEYAMKTDLGTTRLRAGFLYEQAANAPEAMDISALDWDKMGFSVGASHPVTPNIDVDIGYLLIPQTEISITNSSLQSVNIFDAERDPESPNVGQPTGQQLTTVGNGDYKLSHQRIMASIRARFGG